ncbi:MAG: hypothetical protein KJ583_07005 [Nanoarchaeota archaeon]|nr:hypothetical protein [Nanoarchaeota archaeon]MBU1269205.1 hypothetical protein [Nanoarchaeota archaeon]MBU1605034.1 hypothetical protein [Nanoarchaeota archaeon]MBU2443586.1 hypothetical protein [Nanoarchaeota archaeon]
MAKKTLKTADKNQLRNFTIIICVLIIVFFGTIYVGKHINKKEVDKSKYNGFDFYFEKNQGLWLTRIEIGNTPYDIPFYNHPRDLEDIIVETNVENIILKEKPQKIIISIPANSGSEMAIAGIEISKITGERYQVLNIPTKSAFSEFVEGMPFATCSDANEKTVVISFKKSNKNLISSEGRCILLEFKEGDAIRVADTLAYKLLKIM